MMLWGKPRHRQHLPDGRDVAIHLAIGAAWLVIVFGVLWVST